MRRKPSASTVCFWSLVYPMGLCTNVTRTVFSPVSFLGILLPPFPERQQLTDVLAAACSFFLRRLQLLEGVEGCLDHIQYVGATLGLGQNIAHTGYFEHGTHTTRGDYARSRRSRFEHYTCACHLPQNFMRDRCAREIDN